MGVYIKGMGMPKSCFQCEFRTKIDPDNLMCIISQKTFEERFYHFENRDENCPLITVPPHGRLVDADALQVDMMEIVASGIYGEEDCIDAVIEAPTIIPASGKEGEG